MTEAAQSICPTCGTRVAEDATRCVVCGTELRGRAGAPATRQVRLELRVALGLVAGLTVISAGITYAATRFVLPAPASAEPTASPSPSPTQSLTPSTTPTPTTQPSATPLPPINYTVVEGDTCGGIAFFFDVSVRSIIEINNLGTECVLSIGQQVLIPQPTPTVTPEPSATLSPEQATEAACPKENYTVEANDTLFGIAQNYNVAVQSIKDYNGLVSDTVFQGQRLVIPLCERLTVGGATPTPTLPPPYPAPNLLLPRDGEAFSLANETISLQWASVGALREGEFYRVTIVDVTDQTTGSGERTLIDYVTNTNYIVPADFRPSGTAVHALRWWVETVRLSGTTTGGEPRYVSAGASSVKRVFTWFGGALSATATP